MKSMRARSMRHLSDTGRGTEYFELWMEGMHAGVCIMRVMPREGRDSVELQMEGCMLQHAS
jgi:hypothetical protein